MAYVYGNLTVDRSDGDFRKYDSFVDIEMLRVVPFKGQTVLRQPIS